MTGRRGGAQERSTPRLRCPPHALVSGIASREVLVTEPRYVIGLLEHVNAVRYRPRAPYALVGTPGSAKATEHGRRPLRQPSQNSNVARVPSDHRSGSSGLCLKVALSGHSARVAAVSMHWPHHRKVCRQSAPRPRAPRARHRLGAALGASEDVLQEPRVRGQRHLRACPRSNPNRVQSSHPYVSRRITSLHSIQGCSSILDCHAFRPIGLDFGRIQARGCHRIVAARACTGINHGISRLPCVRPRTRI